MALASRIRCTVDQGETQPCDGKGKQVAVPLSILAPRKKQMKNQQITTELPILQVSSLRSMLGMSWDTQLFPEHRGEIVQQANKDLTT